MTAPVRAPLGVLGGMGPLASAEFLKSIYEVEIPGPEQNTPAVVLHSDPSMPDRTTAFLNGRSEIVLERFITALERLDREGVSKIVVCCITIHYLLPQLPPPFSTIPPPFPFAVFFEIRFRCAGVVPPMRLPEELLSTTPWPVFADGVVPLGAMPT